MEHWHKLVDRYDLKESELKQIPSDNVTNFLTVISIYKKRGWDASTLLEGTNLNLDDFNDSSRWMNPRESEQISRNFYSNAPVFLSHRFGYEIGLELENTKSILKTFIKYTPFKTLLGNAHRTSKKLENSFYYETTNPKPNSYTFKIVPKAFKSLTGIGHESHVAKGYLDAVHKLKNVKMVNQKSVCYSTELKRIIDFFYKDHGFSYDSDKIYRNGELFAERRSPESIQELISLKDWNYNDQVYLILKDYAYSGEIIFKKGEIYNAPFCLYTWDVEPKTFFIQKFKDLFLFLKNKRLNELEDQLLQNNQKAKELHQMSVLLEEEKKNKTLFLANIVHEIKSPLASIVMLIESLKEHIDCAPNFVKEGFSLLDDKSSKLTNFVDNVVGFFSVDNKSYTLNQEVIDLAFLMNDVLDSFTPVPDSKDLYIDCFIEPDRYIISGDYYRLVQVFINIIGNSVKFTDNGTIKIKAGFNSDFAVVSIEDTGIGIEPSKISGIFNMFELNKANPESNKHGLGLGLYIAKTIVEMHGGYIEVSSQYGKGTEFRINLPYYCI